MIALWIIGILKRRYGRIAGTFAGVILTVALISTLAMFLVTSGSSMTMRAISSVPIDWQVEAVPSANTADIAAAIHKAAPVAAAHQVRYAQVSGFQAVTGGTSQVTGPGKVIAFDADYARDFPQELRTLAGDAAGTLIAQQTAANLHVGPGDTITIARIGLPPEKVTIDGVVDLPDADALFQGIGLPPQAMPQAPPDNVLILPIGEWHRIFGPQQVARPDTTRLQFHVRLVHDMLPTSPREAYTVVEGASKNLEAQVAGQALVSNNLGSRLDAVRGDALYATVLFLFLGVPGVALACLLTISVAAAGADRVRSEQALLRIRGASAGRIVALALSEAIFTGLLGTIAGLLLSLAFGRFSLMLPNVRLAVVWPILIAGLAGGTIVLIALSVPAWNVARAWTVSNSRGVIGRRGAPRWQRLWLDVLFLAIAALFFWQSESTGYEVVLAPEGVPAAAVDYKAFLAPAFFWAGAALLTLRLSGYCLAIDSWLLSWLIRPFAGNLTQVVAASLSFQSRRLTHGIAMTSIAISFATSTAVFNETYGVQARVDAELTNGADVTVFGTSAKPAGDKLPVLAALPGLAAAQPMQHRFAYVGADLQDMYGIEPRTLGMATSLADAYFAGRSARQTMERLAATPNGVLVSEETVNDFQLKEGDTINLRLINATDNQYHPIPFTFVGIAREFPTAPKDSFLVANASYIAETTASGAFEYVLMRAKADPADLLSKTTKVLGSGSALIVRDISSASQIIASSLTAVDLTNLTAIELSFAIVMAVATAGLSQGLAFADRRRNFAILVALGARPRQLRAFLWSEGIVVVLGGGLFGFASGAITAWMLVKLLTGVFDPAPDRLSIPWLYLGSVIAVVAASVCATVFVTSARSGVRAEEILRDF